MFLSSWVDEVVGIVRSLERDRILKDSCRIEWRSFSV